MATSQPVLRGKEPTAPELLKEAARDFLTRLKEQRNIKLVDVASRMEKSISTVCSWYYKRKAPNYVERKALESEYKMRFRIRRNGHANAN